jgi:hypothetical protein
MDMVMKGINTPGQALDSGGVASFSTPRDGVSHLAFPALARERNHHADSFPLAPLGNKLPVYHHVCHDHSLTIEFFSALLHQVLQPQHQVYKPAVFTILYKIHRQGILEFAC